VYFYQVLLQPLGKGYTQSQIYVIKHIIKKKEKQRLDTLVLYQFTVLFSAQFSDLCKLRGVDFNVDIIEVTCPRGCASSLNIWARKDYIDA